LGSYPYSDVHFPLSKSGLSKSHSALGEPALGEWREKRDIFVLMNLRLLTLSLIFLALQAMEAGAQDTTASRSFPAPADTVGGASSRPSGPQDLQPSAKDSMRILSVIDTVTVSRRQEPVDALFPAQTGFTSVYGPYVGGYMKADQRFKVTAPVRQKPVQVRSVENRDWVFYFFSGLLLIVALVRLVFSKYFTGIFRVFFSTSMRYLQLREQLSQTPLPSLLLNLVFCLSGGAFLSFLFRQYDIHSSYDQFAELTIFSGIIATVYLFKYVFISLLGWMFDHRGTAENYLFTIFMVNKLAGLALIPLSILMAYTQPGRGAWLISLTLMVLIILILIRLTKGFQAIRTLRVGLFQFLLFVAAFEVAPVLLVGKLFMRFIV